MEKNYYFLLMLKFIPILFCFFLFSCEKVVLRNSDLTLSGKYKLTLLDVTSVDQNVNSDSLYTTGMTFVNRALPKPFDSLVVNRFYIHLDYSTVRINLLGVTQDGRDIWQYGVSPNDIFYRILNNNAYNLGYLQFDLISEGTSKTVTFHIEEDGLESLQLQSTGSWSIGKFGEKQILTMRFTRVGP